MPHLCNIVKVQQQRCVALEAVGSGQQRRKGILMRQEVLTWQVPAAAAHRVGGVDAVTYTVQSVHQRHVQLQRRRMQGYATADCRMAEHGAQ
jgi:hypothetical protein